MSKSIVQRVKYILRHQTSDIDKDQIEEVEYLNIFKDGDNLYGWKEYDMRVGKPLKSDSWKLGCLMDLQFIKKDVANYGNKKITIIQRPKVVN